MINPTRLTSGQISIVIHPRNGMCAMIDKPIHNMVQTTAKKRHWNAWKRMARLQCWQTGGKGKS